MLNGCTISWKSSKKDKTTDSIMEVQCVAASEAAKEIVEIRKFLMCLGVVQGASNSLEVYSDNNNYCYYASHGTSFNSSLMRESSS